MYTPNHIVAGMTADAIRSIRKVGIAAALCFTRSMIRVTFVLLMFAITACGAGSSSAPASAAPGPSYAVNAARTPEGYELRLREPGGDPSGMVSVAVLDPDGLLIAVAGTWGEDSPDARGLTTVVNPPSRPDILEVYWSGHCADEAVITTEQTADGVGITLDSAPGQDASTCQPRGFVHLMVALALARPWPADRTETTDLRPGYRDVP
jgi:hypothetical protein